MTLGGRLSSSWGKSHRGNQPILCSHEHPQEPGECIHHQGEEGPPLLAFAQHVTHSCVPAPPPSTGTTIYLTQCLFQVHMRLLLPCKTDILSNMRYINKSRFLSIHSVPGYFAMFFICVILFNLLNMSITCCYHLSDEDPEALLSTHSGLLKLNLTFSLQTVEAQVKRFNLVLLKKHQAWT